MDKTQHLKAAYAGIDTHKQTHMLGLIDEFGRELGTWEFVTTQKGYKELAEKIGNTNIPVGIEGTRSYGTGIALYLSANGFNVYEVIRPKKEQRRLGKTDAIDAISAARSVAAGKGYIVKDISGLYEDLHAKMILREHYIDSYKKLGQRIDALTTTAPINFCERWRKDRKVDIHKLAKSHPKDNFGKTLKEFAQQWIEAHKRAVELESDIAEINLQIAPALMSALGVGAINAAKILLAVGANPARLKDESSFSMYAGTSPLPACSGITNRHRLNRGGNRQLNCAIHSIALCRMISDERTQAYIEKKMAEGKSKREVTRCLCRYIAREIYKLLLSGDKAIEKGQDLAQKRKELGLTQVFVAEAICVHPRKIGRLENGQLFDKAVSKKYADFLDKYAAEKNVQNV